MSEFSTDDHQFMARTIRLAERGLYTTMPNPRVGCLIVQAGTVVGEGWHEWAGGAHAEINALNKAADKARGSIVYVSLEPCSHYGKTPPCAKALIEAGVSKVVAAMQDPNPLVSGRGLALLKNAGITVSSGLLKQEAIALNRGFLKRLLSGKPIVRAKLAMSMDGRTGMASGESKWITGPDARSDVQQLRASSCAIITGVGSILKDNSSLTLRTEDLRITNAKQVCTRQPLRVILDSRLQTPSSANVITQPGPCLIVSTKTANMYRKQALEKAGAEVLIQDTDKKRVCLNTLIHELGARGCNEVLVEAGSTLSGAFFQEKLLDELIIYMAPVIMGSLAKPLVQLPFDRMAEKQELSITDIRSVGKDWRITATP